VSDRVVVITGAAHGIGAESARQLIAKGAFVALLDRDESAVKTLAAELGERAEGFAVDVSDAPGVDAAMAAVVRRFGGIDVVVANAGIAGPGATVSAVDPAAFEQVIDINLLGVFRTVRAALPHVLERNGYVLVTASIAAAIAVPTIPAYGAAKSGVEAFGRTLRVELAHTGTRVGIAYFGAIDTGMVSGLLTGTGLAALLDALPNWLGKPAPVGAAGAAVVAGIERRSRRVCAPSYVPLLLALRTPLAMADPLLARIPKVRAEILRADVAPTGVRS
jgi:NAD(P)-dependent dehydrogenase (short-subunit alcohol dehydrogenase family)